MNKPKLSEADKIVVATLSALSSLDSKVLAMALISPVLKGMPESMREGKSDDHMKGMASLAAIGLVHGMMDAMKKAVVKQKAAAESVAEKPDSAFSEQDKAKAQEILSAFMARSGVHLHEDGESGPSK